MGVLQRWRIAPDCKSGVRKEPQQVRILPLPLSCKVNDIKVCRGFGNLLIESAVGLFIDMKKIMLILLFSLLTSCATYRESMQGNWELTEIRNERGDKVYPTCDVDGKCDVVHLSLESHGELLVVTAHDANGKEMKATYSIKEDGRLVNTNRSRPNMYVLDFDAHKIVLIDREMDEVGHERILVFKKVEE
jgi:hypothetical protein